MTTAADGPCYRKGDRPWTTDNSSAMCCGPDGFRRSRGKKPPDLRRRSVGTRIDIVSDAICPWCYIGKRQLERALATLANEGLTFQVHWNPFQLNPDMPKEGRDRAAYRAWKFGSAEKAAALDQRITEAAAAVGLEFRTDLMTRTPNTIDAHRLIWFAGQNGNQDAAMEAVFKAYFIEGRDIGDHAVLADCAAEAGLPRQDCVDFLAATWPTRRCGRRIRPRARPACPASRRSSWMATACSPAPCRRTRLPTRYGAAGDVLHSRRRWKHPGQSEE